MVNGQKLNTADLGGRSIKSEVITIDECCTGMDALQIMTNSLKAYVAVADDSFMTVKSPHAEHPGALAAHLLWQQ